MRELGLARETVRRFARANSVDDLLAKPRSGRPSILDEFIPHLHQRWNAGCTLATQLFEEIRALGYRGSAGTVRSYLRPFRATRTVPPGRPRPLKVRHVAGWMLRHPDSLDADERLKLKQVRATCPHLDALAGHVTAFAQMMTGRHGDRLDAWIAAVDADDQPDLHSFTAGLKRDHDAVRNGLTLPHSSGAAEGQVNRIKMIKRQMYGRANFDLLRKTNSAGLMTPGRGQRRSRKWARSSFRPALTEGSRRSGQRGSGPWHSARAALRRSLVPQPGLVLG
jgi:hypothetical protein